MLSGALAQLTDEMVRDQLTAGTALSSGIGGETALLNVAGEKVFVKRLVVTEIEQRADNFGRTLNVFDLPAHCHYGVGAPSGGVWRELSMHKLTTEWVLDARCDAFPLLYHSRLLAMPAPATLDCAEHGDLETWVAFWHGSDAVRGRLKALRDSSAELLLFLEYVPQNLFSWLGDRLSDPSEVLDAALSRVESQLIDATTFMANHGVCHFDVHFRNILADDVRLYVGDFGLAASSTFELTHDETSFLREHLSHDVAYVLTELVNWIVTRLADAARDWKHPRDRNEFVQRCATGFSPSELSSAAARILRRYAPIAAVMNAFYFDLHGTSRLTPYPAGSVRDALAAAGVDWRRGSAI